MSGFSKMKSATAWLGVIAITVHEASMRFGALGLQVHADAPSNETFAAGASTGWTLRDLELMLEVDSVTEPFVRTLKTLLSDDNANGINEKIESDDTFRKSFQDWAERLLPKVQQKLTVLKRKNISLRDYYKLSQERQVPSENMAWETNLTEVKTRLDHYLSKAKQDADWVKVSLSNDADWQMVNEIV